MLRLDELPTTGIRVPATRRLRPADSTRVDWHDALLRSVRLSLRTPRDRKDWAFHQCPAVILVAVNVFAGFPMAGRDGIMDVNWCRYRCPHVGGREDSSAVADLSG